MKPDISTWGKGGHFYFVLTPARPIPRFSLRSGDTSDKSFSVTVREKGVHGAYVQRAVEPIPYVLLGPRVGFVPQREVTRPEAQVRERDVVVDPSPRNLAGVVPGEPRQPVLLRARQHGRGVCDRVSDPLPALFARGRRPAGTPSLAV